MTTVCAIIKLQFEQINKGCSPTWLGLHQIMKSSIFRLLQPQQFNKGGSQTF